MVPRLHIHTGLFGKFVPMCNALSPGAYRIYVKTPNKIQIRSKQQPMEPRNRLIRTDSDRMIAGVCGGIAAYLAVDPLWIRLAFVVLSAASGVGLLSYIILWLIMPNGRNVDWNAKAVFGDNWEHLGDTMYDSASRFKRHPQTTTIVAVALIAFGIVLLLANLGSVASLLVAAFWPLLGLAILVVGLRRLRG
jgi:phage shock protein PspC (stress-responsive transcriptional regulator)